LLSRWNTGAAVQADLTFAAQADAIVMIDARGNLYRQRLLLLDASSAAAGRARLGNDLAGAVALRTGLLDREKSLRHANLALSVAGRTGLGLRARLGPRPVAGRAILHRRNAYLCLGSARGFLERELEVVAQVGAAINAVAATAPAAPAENFAEDIAKSIGKPAEALGTRTARPRGAETGRRIDAGMAVLVVRRAFPRVAKDLVRLLGFLEFIFGALVGIAIRMVFHREPPIRLLDVVFGRVAIDTERRVIVPLSHASPVPHSRADRSTADLRTHYHQPRSIAAA
jgi:hypothetical protein